jgi:hypothetical protein
MGKVREKPKAGIEQAASTVGARVVDRENTWLAAESKQQHHDSEYRHQGQAPELHV